MVFDLGRVYPLEQVNLINTNASESCEYDITASVNVDFSSPVLDTARTFFYPQVYVPDDVEFEDDNWYTLTYTAEELSREQRNLYVNFPKVYARYVRVRVYDSGNVDGFFSIGRVFIPKKVWQFEYNYNYGAQLSLESNVLSDKSLGGVAYFEEHPQTKVFSFELSWLTPQEAYSKAYEIMRSQDTSGEVLILPDKTDSINLFRNAVYGRMRQLNPVNAAVFGYYGTSFQIEGLR